MKNWTIGTDLIKPALTAGDFELTQNGTMATCRLRSGGPPIVGNDSGVSERLLAAAREKLADHPDAKLLDELEGKRADLERQIATADGRLKKLADRKADPALLGDAKMGSKLVAIDAEVDQVSTLKNEAQVALRHVEGLRIPVKDRYHRTIGRTVEDLFHEQQREVLAKRVELLAKLAEAVSPILDQLVENHASLLPIDANVIAAAVRALIPASPAVGVAMIDRPQSPLPVPPRQAAVAGV